MPTDTKTHISTSGGLLTQAFIENVRNLKTSLPGTEAAAFTLPWDGQAKGQGDLEGDVAAAWELLMERWDAIRKDFPEMDTSEVRQRWLLPLFGLLDFEPDYQRGDTVLADDLRFPLSHRGWASRQANGQAGDEAAPALHLVPPTQALDEKSGPGRGLKAKSPHDMVQVFLNTNPTDRWAVLSNGRFLRLLRDYHHTFSKGYVQFDLESIFETRNFSDFRALYRLCHASRFHVPETDEEKSEEAQCPLEGFYETALSTGVKVGEDLRGQVRDAIEHLGNGFLDTELIRELQGDPEAAQDYYSEILRVVYRMLFLLFAEQRGLVPRSGAELEGLYRRQYSLTALRERAEEDLPDRDEHADLWHGLAVTFQMLEKGAEELGVFGYDGMLFDTSRADFLAGSRACDNASLLKAVRSLTLIEREGVLQRISFLDLGVEELGSIYESLLDFTPRVTEHAEEVNGREVTANTFFLDPRGLERKQSGSYYTPESLVNQLMKSALLPVMRSALREADLPVVGEDALDEALTGLLEGYDDVPSDDRERGVAALLDLDVCDPAAGSGHFLVNANNVLGAEVARLREGTEYPDEDTVQEAKRDVLARSIYAVDLNPMAVELCKVSLWINASVADRPLNFLDHHIKCGNALIGATPELLADGVPYEAFALGRPGDDRDLAKQLRKQNRQERKESKEGQGVQTGAFRVTALLESEEDVQQYLELEGLAETNPSLAREKFIEYRAGDEYNEAKMEADLWTAAFFWPMPEGTDWAPTYSELFRYQRQGPVAIPHEKQQAVERLAEKHRFFHWHVEFPDVFGSTGGIADGTNGHADASDSDGGGFDVVLGNPPWERIKLQEKEFFAEKAPEIAGASTAAKRRKKIEALKEVGDPLHAEYQEAQRGSEALSTFLRESGRYPLSAVGDINTYQIFAGLVRQVVSRAGRVGTVVPSGIATDYYNQDYFNALVEEHALASLYDFENREGLFHGVDSRMKFCLLTLTGPGAPAQEIDFAFFLTQADQLADDERHFTMTRADLREINPNTGTCPTFRTRRDAELTKTLYDAAPVLVNEEADENPWGVSFLRMFDMSNDSGLFRTREELEDDGFELRGNRFEAEGEAYLPLYEAKMLHQFDHRFATYETTDNARDFAAGEHGNAECFPLSRHWVNEKNLSHGRDWWLAFRDIARATDVRTGIFSIIPKAGVGHTAPLILLPSYKTPKRCALLASLNAFTLDFAVRQKLGGTHLTFYILKQLPVLPPERYTPALLRFIVPRVMELSYTAWDLAAFADDVWREAGDALKEAVADQWQASAEATGGGHRGAAPPDWVECSGDAEESFPHAPFMWDAERRRRLRAELDALYGHLYGLEREELSYILDTFPIVKRKDVEAFGDYRTKRLVLKQYDAQEENSVDEEFKIRDAAGPDAPSFFRRAVITAEIIHQLHRERTLGQTKLQKLQFLCELHAGIQDIRTKYFRKQRGPLDNKFVYGVESMAEKQRWFSATKEQDRTYYEPLEGDGSHRKYFNKYREEQRQKIQQVLETMRSWDTERCGIVATLYAAWNDLLIEGEDPDDEEILREVLNDWNESKKDISEKRWRRALGWMKKEGWVPQGHGSKTIKTEPG